MKVLRLPRILERPIASVQNTLCPARKTHGSLTECCAGHGILRQSANPKNRRGATARTVLKKGPFRAKLWPSRQLFATAAMVLELRLSQRRSLARQEDSTAWRPCHQKTHFALKSRVFAARLPQKTHTRVAAISSKVHRANLPIAVLPAKKTSVNGTTARRTCQHCRTENNFLRTGPREPSANLARTSI